MGLSKPVITTSTDISGITSTLSEIKTLSQEAASAAANSGAVKSVQKGFIQADFAKKTYKVDNTTCVQYNAKYGVYLDITISNVDLSKTAVFINTFTDSTTNVDFIGVLTSATNLRIYMYSTDTTGTVSEYLRGGTTWQVVEYK